MTTLDKQQELEALLPFYVNGSLDESEKERLEQALTEDENLRQELAFVETLQRQVQQQTVSSPGELGLKRLQRSLKQAQLEGQSSQQQPTKSNKGWQFAAIAASLMLVLQTVTVVQQRDDYIAAGGDNTIQQYTATVTVAFADGVTEQQIRQLLLEHQLLIIDGPSALGLYRLAIQANTEQTIQTLQTRKDLIDSIQQD